MRSRIRALLGLALALAVLGGVAAAYSPSVADLDAEARSVGNRRDLAERAGEQIFATKWPAEVNQISANEMNDHLILGIRIWGVKFHEPMTRQQFVDEVAAVVEKALAAVPAAEEVDVWASVPIDVSKDTVVSGDLAKPTSRTVFSLTVRRGETSDQLRARALDAKGGVFWDDQWARAAFKES